VQVNAKVDYALRALAELAVAGPGPVKAEVIARAQSIPLKFLENILLELRHAGIVISQRGAVGGYRLGRPAEEITLADVIRVVDGPLANVRGLTPERLEYSGAATPLRDVWIALRVNMRAVLERVTIADLQRGALPPEVMELTRAPDAWMRRTG
jgi:Rrf2 family protein